MSTKPEENVFLGIVTRYSYATLPCLAILNRKRKICENLNFRTIQWIILATKIDRNGKFQKEMFQNVRLPQSRLSAFFFFQNLNRIDCTRKKLHVHPAEWTSRLVVFIVGISEIIIHRHLVKSLLIIFKLFVSYT